MDFPEEYRSEVTEKAQLTAIDTIMKFRRGKQEDWETMEPKLTPLVLEIRAENPALSMMESLTLAYAKVRG